MKNTTETTYEKFLASEKSNTLAEAYEKYENDVSYEQHVLDSQNQKTPVWKEIKGDTDIIAEVGQKLSFNIYDAKLEHPESISDCKIVITRTKNNEESVKEYSLLDNNLLLIDESEVKVTNYVYIKGEAIELTEEQIAYLREESIFKS